MKTTKKTTTKTEPTKEKVIDVYIVLCGKGPHRMDELQKKLNASVAKSGYVTNCVGIETLPEFCARLSGKDAFKNCKTFVETFHNKGKPVTILLVDGRVIRYSCTDIPADCRHAVNVYFGTEDKLNEYIKDSSNKKGTIINDFIHLAVHQVTFSCNWVELASGYGKSKKSWKEATVRIFGFSTKDESKKKGSKKHD